MVLDMFYEENTKVVVSYLPVWEFFFSMHVLVNPEHHVSRKKWVYAKEVAFPDVINEIRELKEITNSWILVIDSEKWKEIRQMEIVEMLAYFQGKNIYQWNQWIKDSAGSKMSKNDRDRVLRVMKQYYDLVFRKEEIILRTYLMRVLQDEKEKCKKDGMWKWIGTIHSRLQVESINAFVADFIGESNIFNGIVTGKLKARFCGGEFVCVDDIKEGTHITAVVRPEDVQIVAPENGTIRGTVTSVIFKGMHYEITIESGKNEIVAQSVNVAKVGQRVGITVEPDNIHLMVTEDHTNFFKVEINKNKELEYNDNVLDVSLTDIIKGSHFDEDGDLVDSNGIEIDTRKIRVTAAIQPRDIRMTDEQEEGLVQGYISNLIYEGDHYSYVIHTDLEHDFVVDDEYLWNMDDQVGLIMPVDKMKFTVKR